MHIHPEVSVPLVMGIFSTVPQTNSPREHEMMCWCLQKCSRGSCCTFRRASHLSQPLLCSYLLVAIEFTYASFKLLAESLYVELFLLSLWF